MNATYTTYPKEKWSYITEGLQTNKMGLIFARLFVGTKEAAECLMKCFSGMKKALWLLRNDSCRKNQKVAKNLLRYMLHPRSVGEKVIEIGETSAEMNNVEWKLTTGKWEQYRSEDKHREQS
ncbi:hypothetical protein KY289_027651 [Solanum tuberosum]|nr:hypothetical protein KY289_027651 [Solanum tuberosum]